MIFLSEKLNRKDSLEDGGMDGRTTFIEMCRKETGCAVCAVIASNYYWCLPKISQTAECANTGYL